MSGIDVDLGVLSTVSSNLQAAGSTLGELDTGGSTDVDAGPMTSVITGMLAQITNSAGTVSDALTGMGELVALSRRYYQRADADAQASLQDISSAMEE